ncbi:MAG: hypothetical protein QNJ42_11715 [Crocosphaera sp.]|nr:hypothetical protein [Crocosphaera sp.]
MIYKKLLYMAVLAVTVATSNHSMVTAVNIESPTGANRIEEGKIEFFLAQNNEVKPMDLEREKWQAELELRKRELQLKEREQDNRDEAIRIRKAEQATSKWFNPLTVAVFAAAVAAAGNACVAFVNGYQERHLERSKAEYSRILEMIKTDDTEKAADNLEFLLSSGLVNDPPLMNKLRKFLKKRTPGRGPSLPSSNARVGFEQSTALDQELLKRIEQLFDSYFSYLDKVGFSYPEEKVIVKEERKSLNAYYSNNQIFIHSKLADDPTVPLREYNHHLLMLNKDQEWKGNYAAIESGLADYFACSFLNTPYVGEKAIKVYDPNKPYIRTLSNNKNFDELKSLQPWNYPQSGGEVWGGAFWQIRTKLGRDVADSIIASAWLKFKIPTQDEQVPPEFVKMLLAETKAKSPNQVEIVEKILRERKFPLQP